MSQEDPSLGDELQVAFGRMIGFAIVTFGLLLGGGIFLILVGAAVFKFMYGG
jgi:hypothetical protein